LRSTVAWPTQRHSVPETAWEGAEHSPAALCAATSLTMRSWTTPVTIATAMPIAPKIVKTHALILF